MLALVQRDPAQNDEAKRLTPQKHEVPSISATSCPLWSQDLHEQFRGTYISGT